MAAKGKGAAVLVGVVVLLMVTVGAAYANVKMAWMASFGGVERESGADVALTSTGDFVAVGYRDQQLYAVKTDGAGMLLWERTLSLTNLLQAAYSVEESNDGNYWVFGSAYLVGSQGLRPWVLKLDSDGNTIWSSENGFSQTTVVDSAIIHGVERADGSLVLVGGQNTMTDPQLPWRLIVEANGDVIDFDSYPNLREGFGAGTYVNDVIATADGGFALVGIAAPTPGNAFLWKFGATGEPQWVQLYNARGFSSGRELAQGGYILTGCSVNMCGNSVVVKTDAAGALLWEQNYVPASDYSQGADILELPDGNFLLAEIAYEAFGSTPPYDSAIIELDADGNRIGSTPIVGGDESTEIRRLRLTGDGFVLTGATRSEESPLGPQLFLARGLIDRGAPTAIQLDSWTVGENTGAAWGVIAAGLAVGLLVMWGARRRV